jgi:Protein of unknown function (DUF3309)
MNDVTAKRRSRRFAFQQPFLLRGDSMRTLIIVLLVLLVLSALPAWPYSAGWGYYPSSGLGLLLLVILLLAIFRRA